MSNVEVIRDLTESLIAQFIENDSLQKYQNVTKSQVQGAVKAAVRAFKFSLNIQTGTSTIRPELDVKLADADGPLRGPKTESKEVICHKSSLFPTCFNRLAKFREESKAIDVVIKSGPLRIGAHKVVICSAIPYFQGLFMSPVAPGETEVSIEIPGVDPAIIISLIEWAYLGEIKLTNETVQSLLVAAGYLGCEQVITACCDFIDRRMNTDNVLEVVQVAESLSCHDLARRARQFIDRHFCDLFALPVWGSAPPEIVMSILGSSDLYVEQEANVWSAFKNWLIANPSCLPELVHGMLSQVRLHLLPPQFIRDEVLVFDLVSSNIQCRNLIDDAILRHCNVEFSRMKVCDPDDDGLLIDSERLNPRYCSHLQNHIYLLGGFASNAVHESINIVDMFDSSSKQWKHMPQMSRCRGRLGVAVLNGMLYALGGFDCAVRLNSAERFDPKTNKWETVASMLFCRSAPACSAMNGRLYVSGGYNGESCLNSCERYDPVRDVWEEVPSMQRSRSAAAAVCFAGKMFVTGGCDVVQFFNSVEVFDGKKWTEFPPMIHNRCRHGSLVFQGKLWVVGGYNGRFLQTCEQYSFATQQWTPMTQEMNVRRARVGVASSGNKLYAIGGYDGMTNLSSIEIYNPEEGTWSLAGNMNRHEGGVGVAAIPNNCSEILDTISI